MKWWQWVLLLILLDAILNPRAHAQDSWRCTGDSSEIKGNQFFACGVGESPFEGVAREHALTRAAGEFNAICSMTTGCTQKDHSVDPGRTTCEQLENKTWKCYRLLIFTVTLGSVFTAHR